MPISSTGMRIVMRQLREISDKPVDCVSLLPYEDLSELRFEMDGPEGTPFQDGRFSVVLQFDDQYPEVPPKGFFRTLIYHPNVSPDNGAICVNALKRDWNAQVGLRHILVVIRCLLVEPNAESALNEAAGRALLEDYAGYERQARMMTRVHALRGEGVPRHRSSEEDATTETSGTSQLDAQHQSVPEQSVGDESGLRTVDGNCSGTTDRAKKRAIEKRKSALRRI